MTIEEGWRSRSLLHRETTKQYTSLIENSLIMNDPKVESILRQLDGLKNGTTLSVSSSLAMNSNEGSSIDYTAVTSTRLYNHHPSSSTHHTHPTMPTSSCNEIHNLSTSGSDTNFSVHNKSNNDCTTHEHHTNETYPSLLSLLSHSASGINTNLSHIPLPSSISSFSEFEGPPSPSIFTPKFIQFLSNQSQNSIVKYQILNLYQDQKIFEEKLLSKRKELLLEHECKRKDMYAKYITKSCREGDDEKLELELENELKEFHKSILFDLDELILKQKSFLRETLNIPYMKETFHQDELVIQRKIINLLHDFCLHS